MVSTSSIFIFALVFVGSYGGSIHWNVIEDRVPQPLLLKKGGSTIKADYGGAIKDALMGVIATLPPTINVASLPVDLTELGESNDLPVKGQLNLTNLLITGLGGLDVPVSSLVINGIFNAIPLHLRITSPSVKLQADFSIRASLANLIPIRGNGKVTLDLNLVAGIDAEIKPQIGGPVIMPSLAISLGDFNNLGVTIDGQIGGPGDLSKEIIEILEEYTGPVLAKVTSALTATISANIIAIFDSLKLTLAQLIDLINQITNPGTP